MIEQTVLIIYVDGSSKQAPRRGGVGIRYKYTDPQGTDVSENLPWPGYLGANSQQMEINACIVALQQAQAYLARQGFKKIVMLSDSKYVVENYKNAMFLWPKTKWLRVGGAPVLNAALWKELVKQIRDCGVFVEIQKVKGHSKDKDNKIVDKLARQSADDAINAPLDVRIVRRKKSKETTQPGSVGMHGQRITIRIVECQRLSVQKLNRYRYEVMSKHSPYYRKVDFIVSDEALHQTSTYRVLLNKEQANPRIVKVYGKVEPGSKEGPVA